MCITPVLLLLLLIAVAAAQAPPACPHPYPTTGLLGLTLVTPSAANGHAFLELKHRVVDHHVEITLVSNFPSWLAIGFSETGHMLGSDMAVVNLDDAGKPQVLDMAMFWAASPLIDPTSGEPTMPAPKLDPQQDWKLVCADRNDAMRTYSYTIIRALDTKDAHFDRPIVPGSMHVIFAFADDLDSNFMSFHAANRGSTQLAFVPGATAPFHVPADADAHVDLFYHGFDVQPMATQYICATWDVGTEPRHIVAFEPVVTGVKGAEFMHHALIHLCGSDETQFPLDKHPPGKPATACQAGNLREEGVSPLMAGACTQMAWGWALGGAAYALPDVAGLPIGGKDSRYIIVELHVNNPKKLKGTPVVGGMRIHTASRLRAQNATTLQLGDVFVTGLDIDPTLPAGSKAWSKQHQQRRIPLNLPTRHYEANCPSQCTGLMLGPVTAVNSFLHMHQFGRTVFTSRTRQGQTSVVSSIAHWNFGFQVQLRVNYTIAPGDSMSVHCIMDTTKAALAARPQGQPLIWGFASANEMCMVRF